MRRLTNAKEQYFLSDLELKNISKVIDLDRMMKFLVDEKMVDVKSTWQTIPFYRPIKSDESEDGYKGRLGIHEVLRVSIPIKEMILKGSSADEIEKQAKAEGMMTMIEDGIYCAVQGLTSIEEVFRVVSE